MTDVIFTFAKKCDTDEICRLFYDAIEEMDKNGIPQWDEIYPCRADIETDIEKGELRAGRVNGKIAVVYTLNLEYDDEYNKGKWQYSNLPFTVIHRLCVNPEFQNRGIAALTLAHIEDELRNMNIKTIRLDAFTKNPYALRLYAKAGYKKVGIANFRKGSFWLMEKLL